ncbi:MAG: MurR/RpiR family transcriptional regulator [Desulfobacterales bacterium]
MHKQNILQLIKSYKGKYSQQHSKIAVYLINNYEKAAFFTATQLARETGVSQPTVIRFSQFLGFSNYGTFLEAIQAVLKAELTSTQRLNLSLGGKSSADGSEFDIISKEIKTLEKLASTFPHKQYNHLVEEICNSNKVFVVGTRGSASLAHHLAYFLGKVKKNVMPICYGSTSVYDQLLHLRKDDLIIAMAFPRYPRETIDIVSYCKEKTVRIAGITDKIDSPLSKISDTAVIIPITFTTIFDSYSSVMCLLNMVVTGVGKTNFKESKMLSQEFESLAKKVKIFV